MKQLLVAAGAAVLVLLAGQQPVPVRGQEKKEPDAKQPEPKAKSLKIRWYGNSFFQVEDSAGRKFAFDPHGIPAFGRQFVPADFVIVSHSHDDHALVEMIDKGVNKKDERIIISPNDVYRGVVEPKPGKQEWKLIDEKRGNIRIRNVATYHDTQNGMTRGKNSIFIVEVDGLVVCHLGDLGHELTADQVKAIGKVDILMIPVGGVYTINGEQAQKVMKQLNPRLYVLPMHYGVPGFDDLAGPDEFLEDQKNVKKMQTNNELVVPLDMKADEPTIVLLGWKPAELLPPKK